MEELCLAMEKLSLHPTKIKQHKTLKSTVAKKLRKNKYKKSKKNKKNGKYNKNFRCWKCFKLGHKKKFCKSKQPIKSWKVRGTSNQHKGK